MVAFVDKAKIRVISGAGGNGALAWRREKYVDKGGPAGGDGGNGGDVYFVATSDMSTLLDFTHKSVYKAERGENGKNKNCHGKNGDNLYIKMPVGVLVRDLKSGNNVPAPPKGLIQRGWDLIAGSEEYPKLALIKSVFSAKDCCLHDSATVSSEGSPLGEVAEVTIFFLTCANKITDFY